MRNWIQLVRTILIQYTCQYEYSQLKVEEGFECSSVVTFRVMRAVYLTFIRKQLPYSVICGSNFT